jgi:hypothetical protein
VSTSPDDLASLLAECHSAWMTARQSLMGGRVSDEVSRMDPGRSDLVDLVSYLVSSMIFLCVGLSLMYSDPRGMLVPQANLHGRVQPLQGVLPLWRAAALVRLTFLFVCI